MMATPNKPDQVRVLWNPSDIQEFMGKDNDHNLKELINDLLTLEPSSLALWLILSPNSQSKEVSSDKVVEEKRESFSTTNQDLSALAASLKLSNEKSPPVCLTTVGLLLLSTVTCQKGSLTLLKSVRKLVKQSYAKSGFQQHLRKVPTLMGSGLDGLLAFCNFCIGHCLLCTADGSVVRDVGILKVWSNTVQPLGLLLDSLIIDHLETSGTWLLEFPVPTNVAILKTFSTHQKAAIYSQFHSYDFDGDRRYQCGVQQIRKQLLAAEGVGHGADKKDLELQAKVYYYSRFIQKVSREDYVAWLTHSKSSDSSQKTVSNSEEDTGINSESTHDVTSDSTQDVTTDTIQELTVDTKQDVTSKPKQVVAFNSKQDVTSGTTQDVTSDATLDVAFDAKQDMTSDQTQDVASDTTQVVNSDTTQDVAFGTTQNVAYGAKQDMTSETTQDVTMNTKQEVTSVPTQDMTSDTTQDMTSDTIQDVTMDTKEDVTSDTRRDVASDTTKAVTSDTIQDVTFDPSQDRILEPTPYPTSFLEILRLIESGEDIPGIEVLDVKPTGAKPVESKMSPVKKPWLK